MHFPPIGMITLWAGAIVDIPDDWALCDGNNGTPDLRERFVIGAGGALAPGATGGGTTHTHTGTTAGHFHTLPPGVALQGGNSFLRDTSLANDTFTTNAASSLPPYYALAFIMKVS